MWDTLYAITVTEATGGTLEATKTFAKQGETVILTVTPDTRYRIGSVKYNNTVINAGYFTMPAENVTITAEFEKISDVSYIDSDGNEMQHNEPTSITSSTGEFTAGWYVVDSDVTLGGLNYSGDVHIILMDDKTLTVTGTMIGADNSTLSVYGQKNNSGRIIAGTPESWLIDTHGDLIFVGENISASDDQNYCMIKALGNVIVTKADIRLTSDRSDGPALCCRDLLISGGSVEVSSANYTNALEVTRDLRINGGNVDLNGCVKVGRMAFFRMMNQTDSIYAKSFDGTFEFVMPLTDGTDIYQDNMTQEQLEAAAGRRLRFCAVDGKINNLNAPTDSQLKFFGLFSAQNVNLKYVAVIATTKESVGMDLNYDNCTYIKGKSDPILDEDGTFSLYWTRSNVKKVRYGS